MSPLDRRAKTATKMRLSSLERTTTEGIEVMVDR